MDSERRARLGKAVKRCFPEHCEIVLWTRGHKESDFEPHNLTDLDLCHRLRTRIVQTKPSEDGIAGLVFDIDGLDGVAATVAPRSRLDLERKKVNAMLNGLDDTDNLVGTLTNNPCGERLSLFYAGMTHSDWFQGLAPPTRPIVTGHRLLELDISGAHPTVSWSAIVLKYGEQTACSKCPVLRRVALSRDAFIDDLTTNNGYFDDAASGKRALLAALNQAPHDPPSLEELKASLPSKLVPFEQGEGHQPYTHNRKQHKVAIQKRQERLLRTQVQANIREAFTGTPPPHPE